MARCTSASGYPSSADRSGTHTDGGQRFFLDDISPYLPPNSLWEDKGIIGIKQGNLFPDVR